MTIAKTLYVLLMALPVLVILPENASAYLDPGTGSYIFQVLLAAIIGGLFAIKTYWLKIRDFINRVFKKP
ncbi:MAG TPA: hypothetical protein PLR20_01475 [Syntrophales bacterium]|jgi:hypothetical protein|nr:hypothetical protein [Syntrophales bacterium]HOX93589.1 hypothetical protein [Syntrophales bacterium]HPI56884.1 hypothetical protein [Syntrophales bacterium]HPN23470.1 hypothetical protein [Syntrophales bacterium]HQM28005.1 hypothetical protein [Syntrophales bacterium]